MRLGATPDGKLTSLQHDYVNHTSILDDYEEDCGEATPFLYSVPNLRVTVAAGSAQRRHADRHARAGRRAGPLRHRVGDERAGRRAQDGPGRSFASMNEPKIDESQGIPFSSRHLRRML